MKIGNRTITFDTGANWAHWSLGIGIHTAGFVYVGIGPFWAQVDW